MNWIRTVPTLLGIAVATTMTLPNTAAAAVNNIVLVHGMNMDGGARRAVYERLTADGYNVTVVQLPMTSIEDDLASTRRAIDAQKGPMVLVGHSYGDWSSVRLERPRASRLWCMSRRFSRRLAKARIS